MSYEEVDGPAYSKIYNLAAVGSSNILKFCNTNKN